MIPEHIAVIFDGNRRYAAKLGLNPWEGHRAGARKAEETIEWAAEKGIKFLTGYALSIENLESRPRRELKKLFSMASKMFDEFLDSNHIVHDKGIRIRFAGRLDLLPDDLREKMAEVERVTRDYDSFLYTACIGYGGRQEIVSACREISRKVMEGSVEPDRIDDALFSEHLWVSGVPAPDMVIRTGGEKRLSNFLPFQSAYSELFFVDKNWPEVTKDDFEGILSEFSARQRRFGS